VKVSFFGLERTRSGIPLAIYRHPTLLSPITNLAETMNSSISLDIDSDLLREAATCAREEGTSMEAVIERLLRDYVENDDEEEVTRIHDRVGRSLRDAETGFAW